MDIWQLTMFGVLRTLTVLVFVFLALALTMKLLRLMDAAIPWLDASRERGSD